MDFTGIEDISFMSTCDETTGQLFIFMEQNESTVPVRKGGKRHGVMGCLSADSEVVFFWDKP